MSQGNFYADKRYSNVTHTPNPGSLVFCNDAFSRYSGSPLVWKPSHSFHGTVALELPTNNMRITAAGTAPVSHRIPLHQVV